MSFTVGDQSSRMDRKASPLSFSVRLTLSSKRDTEARQLSRTPEGIFFGEAPSRRSSSGCLRGNSSVPRTEQSQTVESWRRRIWNDIRLTQDPAWHARQVKAAHIPARLRVPFRLLFRWQLGKDGWLCVFPILSRKYTHIESCSHAITVIVSLFMAGVIKTHVRREKP